MPKKRAIRVPVKIRLKHVKILTSLKVRELGAIRVLKMQAEMTPEERDLEIIMRMSRLLDQIEKDRGLIKMTMSLLDFTIHELRIRRNQTLELNAIAETVGAPRKASETQSPTGQ